MTWRGVSYATGTTGMMSVIAEERAKRAGYGLPVVLAERTEDDDGSPCWRADGADNWTLVWGAKIKIDAERACVVFTPLTMLGTATVAFVVPYAELLDAATVLEFRREGRAALFARPTDNDGPSTQRLESCG